MLTMPVNALRVVSELAASQHNVVTRSQAAAEHVHRNQIRRLIDTGVVVEMASGGLVLLPGPDGPTWLQRVTGAVLSHPGTVASHTTAARLDNVDGFHVFDEIELTVLLPKALRVPGVAVHRTGHLDRCDIVTVAGVPCTNRARTLCDLGATVEPLMVERALHDAVRRGTSLRWIADTVERLHVSGRSGTRVLAGALADLERAGRVPDSWFEKLVELCLDEPRIGAVVRQYALHDDDGRHVARFDLAIPEVRLGIEAHSREHHFSDEDVASDEHRDHEASVLGWDVMYLGYCSVRSPSSVLARVAARVEARRRLMGAAGPEV